MYTARRRPRRRGAAWPWNAHSLIVHVGALLLLLVSVLAPVTHASSAVWADDDVRYGMQVLALRDGSWEWEYAGRAFDPIGEFRPYRRGDIVDGRQYPYVRHPLYVLVLYGATTVFGIGLGMYVVSMVGLVLAAAAAWLLTEELQPRAGPLGFWLVAASPLLLHAYAPWAHTISAALAGVAFLLVVRVIRSGVSAGRVAGLAAALALGTAVRSESTLFAIAVVLAAVGAGVVTHTRRRRAGETGSDASAAPPLPRELATQAAAFTGCGVAALGVVVLESWVVRRITGGTLNPEGLGAAGTVSPHSSPSWDHLGEFVTEQLGAFWKVTFSASATTGLASWPVVVAVGLGLGFALSWRRLRRSPSALAVLGVAALVVASSYVWRMIRFPEEGASGLFGVWPAALIGLVVVPWRHVHRSVYVLAATCVLFAGAVYVTQYPEGGGFGGADWGGRFLSPATVGIASMVATGVWRRLHEEAHPNARRGAVLFGVVLLLGPSVLVFRMLDHRSRDDVAVLGAIDSVSTETLVIASPVPSIALLAEIGWRLNDDHQVFRTMRAGDLLQGLYDAGYDRVTVAFHPRFPPDVGDYRGSDDVTPAGLQGLRIVVLRR
jgi:protein-S-isoprenylcysteine O-methyltransferase Ste14